MTTAGQDHEKLINDRLRVIRMVQMGGRPPRIQYLVPGVSKKEIFDIYESINGYKPPKGPLPNNKEFFVETQEARLQSSMIALAHTRLKHAGINYVDSYIESYAYYRASFPEEARRLTFDRACLLLQYLAIQEVKVVGCQSCRHDYIELSDNLVHDRNCPLCWWSRKEQKSRPAVAAAARSVRRPQLAVK